MKLIAVATPTVSKRRMPDPVRVEFRGPYRDSSNTAVRPFQGRDISFAIPWALPTATNIHPFGMDAVACRRRQWRTSKRNNQKNNAEITIRVDVAFSRA